MKAPPFSPYPADAARQNPCLCIGLDIAWFGGSKGKPDTQHDCLVHAVVGPKCHAASLHMHPVKLVNRDSDATQIFEAIGRIIEKHEPEGGVILAIDAPLQGAGEIPKERQKVRRACERQLSEARKKIDRQAGGTQAWHPNIQPGKPLAPRVQSLLAKLRSKLGFEPWTMEEAASPRLVIECFPSEAIWAAKRLGGYPRHSKGTAVNAYKKQAGDLTSEELQAIIRRVLLQSFEMPSGIPQHWPTMVEQLIAQMLERDGWLKNGTYRGGKWLDDVVDSAICLATATSYALGNAHVWHDPENPEDGHIVGPGSMQELLTGKIRLI